MWKSVIGSRKSIVQNAFLAAAFSTVGLVWCSDAFAGGVPVFTPGQAGTFTHLSGTPSVGDSPYHVALPISTNTPQLTSHTISFPIDGGNTNASAGIANTQSATTAKIIIGAGTGVSQTDSSNAESASSLEVYFNAEWTVPQTGFGAPLAGNFSLPIGAKVGANGSASASCEVEWDYIRRGSEFPLDSFSDSENFFGGEGGNKVLTSFTAPTVLFSPDQLVSGDILVMTADITFTADADDPTLIEVPTATDFSDLGVTTDQLGSFSTDAVPEPSSLLMAFAGAPAVLLRRRKRHASI